MNSEPASHNDPSPAPRGRRDRRTRLSCGIGMACGAMALGLLIWAKLQLVTGVPRTAVAEPPHPPHPPAARGVVAPEGTTGGALAAPDDRAPR